MNIHHSCEEGENVGMEWKKGYPRLITFCRQCRARMREILFDDIPPRFEGVAGDIVAFVRNRGRRP